MVMHIREGKKYNENVITVRAACRDIVHSDSQRHLIIQCDENRTNLDADKSY
jgi:hypothetical protein